MRALPIPNPADSPANLADVRGAFAQSWDQASAAEAEIEKVPMPTPPGYVAWRIKGTQAITMLPQLVVHAPVLIKRAYGARVMANLTGTCPLCSGTAWISTDAPDPETHPAGWAALDITFGVNHMTGCVTQFGEAEKRWFDKRAIPQEP